MWQKIVEWWEALPFIGKTAIGAGIVATIIVILVIIRGAPLPAEVPYP
jgi:hypothetical protein